MYYIYIPSCMQIMEFIWPIVVHRVVWVQSPFLWWLKCLEYVTDGFGPPQAISRNTWLLWTLTSRRSITCSVASLSRQLGVHHQNDQLTSTPARPQIHPHAAMLGWEFQPRNLCRSMMLLLRNKLPSAQDVPGVWTQPDTWAVDEHVWMPLMGVSLSTRGNKETKKQPHEGGPGCGCAKVGKFRFGSNSGPKWCFHSIWMYTYRFRLIWNI